MPWVGKSMDRKRACKLVQEQMFTMPPKLPRAKPRVMMHFNDAGHDGESALGNFQCDRCRFVAGWVRATETEMRRGIPCPNCNAEDGK